MEFKNNSNPTSQEPATYTVNSNGSDSSVGGNGNGGSGSATYTAKPKKNGLSKLAGWKKGLIIFGIIIIIIVLLAYGCSRATSVNTFEYSEDYIGELHIEGTITETTSSSILSDGSYDHKFLMDRVDAMMNDPKNKGIILFLDTPGGSVYASDEFYLKLMEYKEKTDRPVYAYMGSMAASGGYYISSAADKIIANRNCWTGSIGVTIGTIYDFSEFLDNMGVSTVTITSGANKAMGSSVDPLTEEQKAIYQSLVDEAYEQFVTIVADARSMSIEQVKVLADGRVYTAKQAKENGLIDDIMSFDDAVTLMQEEYDLQNAVVEDMQPESTGSLLDTILGKIVGNGTSANSYDQMKELLGENNKFTITYMANIDK